MKRILVPLLLLLVASAPVLGGEPCPEELSRLAESREVVGTVPFRPGSSTLSEEARGAIDRVVPRLRAADPGRLVIRVEGFASPEGGDDVNVPISMQRAVAVVDYLRQRHRLDRELYLIGFGSRESGLIRGKPGCRAEIALYEDLWRIGNAAVETVVVR